MAAEASTKLVACWYRSSQPARPQRALGESCGTPLAGCGHQHSAVVGDGGGVLTGALMVAISAALAVRGTRRPGVAMHNRKVKVRYSVARPKKHKTSYGPRKLLSGYWQETTEDEEVDIFEWISEGDLNDHPPATVTGVQEVAAYSQIPGCEIQESLLPEYRTIANKTQLKKGVRYHPLLDVDEDHNVIDDIREALESYGESDFSLSDVDVVISYEGLRMLLGFADGSLGEDFRSNGFCTHRKTEPVGIDLTRISRLPEAPNAIYLPSVRNWVKENYRSREGTKFMTFDVSFDKHATGNEDVPCIRNPDYIKHHRLLKCKLGGLRMLVLTTDGASVPSVDKDDLEGRAVEMETINYRNVDDLWNEYLPTRYATMELTGAGMIARAVLDRGTVQRVEEVTREDLRLDRPNLKARSERVLGRVAGLLQRVHTLVSCPGCQGRRLYLQFHDNDLRIVSPAEEYDDEIENTEGFDAELKEMLEFMKGSDPLGR